MKKSAIVLLVIIILAAGGYAIFHKSKNTNNLSSSKTSTTSSAPAVNNSVLITKSDSSTGQYLAEPDGKALYTYGADKSGVSNCIGSCLVTWPAYEDTGSTANLPSGVSTIKRTDNGEVQFTYNGMPLYTFIGDNGSNVTGNGVSNFTIAKPVAAATTTSSSSSTNGGNW